MKSRVDEIIRNQTMDLMESARVQRKEKYKKVREEKEMEKKHFRQEAGDVPRNSPPPAMLKNRSPDYHRVASPNRLPRGNELHRPANQQDIIDIQISSDIKNMANIEKVCRRAPTKKHFTKKSSSTNNLRTKSEIYHRLKTIQHKYTFNSRNLKTDKSYSNENSDYRDEANLKNDNFSETPKTKNDINRDIQTTHLNAHNVKNSKPEAKRSEINNFANKDKRNLSVDNTINKVTDLRTDKNQKSDKFFEKSKISDIPQKARNYVNHTNSTVNNIRNSVSPIRSKTDEFSECPKNYRTFRKIGNYDSSENNNIHVTKDNNLLFETQQNSKYFYNAKSPINKVTGSLRNCNINDANSIVKHYNFETEQNQKNCLSSETLKNVPIIVNNAETQAKNNGYRFGKHMPERRYKEKYFEADHTSRFSRINRQSSKPTPPNSLHQEHNSLRDSGSFRSPLQTEVESEGGSRRRAVVKTVRNNAKVYKAVTFEENKKKSALRISIPHERKNSNCQTSNRNCAKDKTRKKKLVQHDSSHSVRRIDVVPQTEVSKWAAPPTDVAKWAPEGVDDHRMSYYEAWVNTAFTAVSTRSEQERLELERQNLLKSALYGANDRPKSPEEHIFIDLSDEKFRGKITVRRSRRGSKNSQVYEYKTVS